MTKYFDKPHLQNLFERRCKQLEQKLEIKLMKVNELGVTALTVDDNMRQRIQEIVFDKMTQKD